MGMFPPPPRYRNIDRLMGFGWQINSDLSPYEPEEMRYGRRSSFTGSALRTLTAVGRARSNTATLQTAI